MKNRPSITVLTYGTFDVLHRGHIRLLRRARALGTRLVVGLSTDRFNRGKGKRSVFCYRDRKLLLETLRFVDCVIPESCWAQKIRDIKRHRVDVFVMGDDWKGRFDDLKRHCRVVYLPRTRGISTTMIKRVVRQQGELSPAVGKADASIAARMTTATFEVREVRGERPLRSLAAAR